MPLRATAQALSDFAEKVVDAAAQDAEICSLKERLAAAEAQAEEKLRHQNEKHDTDLQHKQALYDAQILHMHIKEIAMADARSERNREMAGCCIDNKIH
ncbi:hypothetical protein V502_05859 [Pseudogymnoascus sp. VKM F-4520 (FW-2644)]|nr:hypothetical protein V502_05859 [Pseudogymnoascus sp. VKM F-4520 (FW-2644)]